MPPVAEAVEPLRHVTSADVGQLRGKQFTYYLKATAAKPDHLDPLVFPAGTTRDQARAYYDGVDDHEAPPYISRFSLKEDDEEVAVVIVPRSVEIGAGDGHSRRPWERPVRSGGS